MHILGAGALDLRLNHVWRDKNYRACTKIVFGSRHIYGPCANVTECGRQADTVHLVEETQRID